MELTLQSAVSQFGSSVKAKLANPGAIGEPEDQLRAPFEQLLKDIAELCNYRKNAVAAVGESSISDLKTRPDYAITVNKNLVGFIELKSPGKGADPRKFKDPHDKSQWKKLSSLPNLIYSDGNSFSLWRDGKIIDSIVHLVGDIESSGRNLQATQDLLKLFENFLRWEPIPPRSAKELARISARLCRLLRDEVTEQLTLGSEALTSLAVDWRRLLFPEASDERFADGYAQAVTFGLLMARAMSINIIDGFESVARDLSKTSTLIGSALRLLTDNAENQETLKTSLGTLTRVLNAVDWQKISKGKQEAWLYFYEDFLEIYDNRLRKRTGSFYTPPEVVNAMVGYVDEVLKSSRFKLFAGIATPAVTFADPATGTGTYILGLLRKISEIITTDQGEGAVSEAITAAIKRMIAFEIQLGPFAVAQLRILAEIVSLTGSQPQNPIRMFVTNTLGNPADDEGWIPGILAPIAQSRKDANKIKREESITVVIGNPPYKEKAKGLGGWVEGKKGEKAPLDEWIPPREWKVGVHAKHLRNLYIYFWRWATWKVFDHGPGNKTGIVCFITVAGFLNGPGFQKMRKYLRQKCDDIWVIDCSPEGHQPNVNTRIFQDVQQPVCIVLASRSRDNEESKPAKVRFHELPTGHRNNKFESLNKISLIDTNWLDCSNEWRSPFLPASKGEWANYPALKDLFIYNGSGVMPGRTWIISPDTETLHRRWQRLINSEANEMEELFHPHLSGEKLGDRHSKKVLTKALAGFKPRKIPVADDKDQCVPPIPYGFRSFDRQWIIPDYRLINRPNPTLWEWHSDRQIYLTVLSRSSPSSGPGITFTGLIPDLDHYKGSFGGRVFPLWSDSITNIRPNLLAYLKQVIEIDVNPEDFFAYLATVVANPAYTLRFEEDLSKPGLRIPITSDRILFLEAVELGRNVIWLHTFGERMIDPSNGRPAQPPRLPEGRRPFIPKEGAIPNTSGDMPNTIDYDESKKRLLIGSGFVENVEPEVWNYEVSGKQVLLHWFSYRKADRSRPIIGDRRPPSPLENIQPNHWIAEYTTELINVINVLGLLVDQEEQQADILEKICESSTITPTMLEEAGAFMIPAGKNQKKKQPEKFTLPFDIVDEQ
ncbi:N-6 DNA methylase [bacterium]|nr:N-6 DNA methylase [candidate division CSSED10-310 bacterium]